jgi:CBS domain containing-hemolysin-like protein
MFYFELMVIGFFLVLLTTLSAVESALSQLSAVSLKLLAEKHEGKDEILNLLAEDRPRVLLPLHLGTQTSLLTISILVTLISIEQAPRYGVLLVFGLMIAVVLVFRLLIPRLITAPDPERAFLILLPVFRYPYTFFRSLAMPIFSALQIVKKNSEENRRDEKVEEPTQEEIQAYIDVGEDEGILEKSDSQLIQSVVEFGDTLVKDVMTPRTEIVAISEKATLRELKDLMVREKHSRIPVYRDQMDNIVGFVYVRTLLSHWEEGKEDAPITPLIHPVLFVPETKRVPDLLRELQKTGDHMAIVIDEFGGVAGLVTIEDLLEEIVGEIRDEDEVQATAEVSQEGAQSYLLRGSTELWKLEELFDLRLNGVDAATVSGLIVSILGRVPTAGEHVAYHRLDFEILESDRKRIHLVRVKQAEAAAKSQG